MTEWFLQILEDQEIGFKTSLIRILISLILGAIVGIERQRRKQSAGFRTFSLITVGTTIMMLISVYVGKVYGGDPTRIAAQVISGIGFLGAGTIIQSKGTIRGMTTASSIWAMAAVGLCVGIGMYTEALIGTVCVLFILVSLERFEKKAGIEWVPRTLEIEFNTLDVPVKDVSKMLQGGHIEAHYTGFQQDLNTQVTVLQFIVYVKIRSNYQETLSKIKDYPDVVRVKMYSE
ncbi:MAG: MgtC/SapB family protein [Bacteroidales bacterium]